MKAEGEVGRGFRSSGRIVDAGLLAWLLVGTLSPQFGCRASEPAVSEDICLLTCPQPTPDFCQNDCPWPSTVSNSAPTNTETWFRITSWLVGGETFACSDATAADVDENPDTSTPHGGSPYDCPRGLNNGLLSLHDLAAGFMGDPASAMTDALSKGNIHLLLRVAASQQDMQGDRVLMTYGLPAASSALTPMENSSAPHSRRSWNECDAAANVECPFALDPIHMGPACSAQPYTFDREVHIDDATDEFQATTTAPTPLPILPPPAGIAEVNAYLWPVYDARVSLRPARDGLATDARVTGISGLVTGWMDSVAVATLLLQLASTVPPEHLDFAERIAPTLVPSFLDLDRNGDGQCDAMSVGVNFTASPVLVDPSAQRETGATRQIAGCQLPKALETCQRNCPAAARGSTPRGPALVSSHLADRP